MLSACLPVTDQHSVQLEQGSDKHFRAFLELFRFAPKAATLCPFVLTSAMHKYHGSYLALPVQS